MSQLAVINGQHVSASAEWWSPPEIVDPARELFTAIDLDPASCFDANVVVRAQRFFTAEVDGLRQQWDATVVWCNPPSRRGETSAWAWWLHGAREWAEGRTRRLLWVVFNPSSFLTIAQEKAWAAGLPTPQQAARVEFRERVHYLRRAPSRGLFGDAAERGDAPPHGSALLLLSDPAEHAAFARAYEHLGDALLPARPAERVGGAR